MGLRRKSFALGKSSFVAVPLRLTFIRLQTTNFFVGAGPLTMDSILAGSCLNPQVSRTDHVDKHVEAFSRNQRNCLHSIYLNRSICLATGLPQTKQTLVFMPDFGHGFRSFALEPSGGGSTTQ